MQDINDKINNMHMGKLIHMLSHEMKRNQPIDKVIKADLTIMQKHILKFILLETMHKDLYQKDIEEEFQIRKSTVTGYVQLMEKNGYLTRESVKGDARKKRLVPTEKAEGLRQAILEDIKLSEKRMEKGIPEEDVITCKHVLYQVLTNSYKENTKEERKEMNKTLLKSVREYKKQSILAPILVILEVLMEVLIPMEMANIIDIGMTSGDLHYIIQRGVILVVMAMLSLFFGISAGNMAAVAGAGYAKNLRHDIFYKVQEFSFKNIDHFATSGLVTRMTTDITNIQMAYMMSIRLLARAPIMIVLSWVMTLKYSVKVALLFLIVIPLLGGTLIFIAKKSTSTLYQSI